MIALIVSCYHNFKTRKGWLVIFLLATVIAAGINISQLQIEDSITAMLPDGESQVAHDFALLQQAPFARQLVINVTATAAISTDELLVATDNLRQALPADLFLNLLSGSADVAAPELFNQLGDYLPVLASDNDLQTIAEQLSPTAIDSSVANDLAQLLQPQGMVLKNKIRRDPLQLERIALQKLGNLNPIPAVQLKNGHFLSQDGKSSLILADTTIPITDAIGGRALLDAFATASQELPLGITADFISGHPYTLANAETIQADMQLVLLVSSIGILLLFVVLIRSWRALFVYLLPLFSMVAAVVATGICFGTVSGITIGFGAVMLGITIDYGLHVYFAWRYGRATQGGEQLIGAVARPVLFGGLTSLAAFSVLLASALPGQRQLAVFAMAGIGTALVLALLFLPHFIGRGKGEGSASALQLRRHIFDRKPKLRLLILLLWLGITCFAAVQGQKLTVNAELRQLSYIPPALEQAEQQLATTWGNVRSRALVFAGGKDLETALQHNEQVWQQLKQLGVEDEVVSLAPLLPSQQMQQQRLVAWETFWQQHQATSRDLLQTAGAKYRFSASAFDPFWQRLNQPAPLIDAAVLNSWGLERAVSSLLLNNGDSYQIITLFPDRPELLAALEHKFGAVAEISLVSQRRFSQQLSREIGADFSQFVSYAGIAVVVLLLLLFRNLTEVLLALLPVLTGLLVMFGGMGWLGLEMNLFNVVAAILIIGLAVDYGIFMVCHGQQEEDLASSRAVLISGLTTLVGFGALLLARHPALHSIGLTVMLGIGAAVPTAVLVIPAFRPKRY